MAFAPSPLNTPTWSVPYGPAEYSPIMPTSYLGAIESTATARSATSRFGTGIRYSRVNGVLNSPAVIANGAGFQRAIASRRLTVAGARTPAEAWNSTRSRYANFAGKAPSTEARARFRNAE